MTKQQPDSSGPRDGVDIESRVETQHGPSAISGASDRLLDRARAGDRSAHAELYEQFAGDVMTVARRMLGSRSRAEDVLQDTFVEVIRGVARFREEAALGTWIHRIAINKCLSQLRSRWWTSRVDGDIGDDPPAGLPGPGLDTQIELERLLDRLPDVTRAVVWLHDAEGFTHREIAELMGRTESFSKSQLHRAHRRLRAELAGEAVEEIEAVCTQEMRTV